MNIKLDLHVHTNASFDSLATKEDAITTAKKKGIFGIAITDHDKVSKSEITDGVLVIGGAEYSTDIGHLLVYFLDRDISEGLTRNNKNRLPWKPLIERAHEAGAITFWAHPYAPFMQKPEEAYLLADGIECYNARIVHSRVKNCNENAQKKCREHNKAFSAGSDGHFPEEIGAAYFCCEIGNKDKTPDELLKEIKMSILSKNGSIYGGTASPVYRAKSQWLRLKSLDRKNRWYTVIPRYIRAVLQGFKGTIAPEKIVF